MEVFVVHLLSTGVFGNWQLGYETWQSVMA
jgi:hypothetical protein